MRCIYYSAQETVIASCLVIFERSTFGSGMSGSAEERKIISLTKKLKQIENEMEANNTVLQFCLQEIIKRDMRIKKLEMFIQAKTIPFHVEDEFYLD